MEYYDLALNTFNPRDVEWLSGIRAGRGLAYRFMGNLDEAQHKLNKALEYGIKRDSAMILHRIAHVYMEMGDIDNAGSFFERSYQASREISDAYHELNNLGDLAKLSLLKGDYSGLGRFRKLYQNYKKQWPDMTYTRAEGMILKHLGDLALGQNPKSLTPAGDYYLEAFVLLAKYETYRAYTVQAQLEALENHLITLEVPTSLRSELGRILYDAWQKNKLTEGHPEALSFFVRWMEEVEHHG